MTPGTKLASAAVVIVAAVAGSLYLFGNGGVGFAPTTTPSAKTAPTPTVDATPTVEATPSPVATPFDPWNPSTYLGWSTYSSQIHGSRIGYPAGWSVAPALRAWEVEADAANDLSDAADHFIAPDDSIRVSVWTASVEAGTTLEEWVAAYCELNTTPCADLNDRLEPALREVRDQHLAGALIEFRDDVQAFMPSWAYDTDMEAIWTDPAPDGGGEIVVVAAWRPAEEFHSRDLVDGFSLQLCPDCAP